MGFILCFYISVCKQNSLVRGFFPMWILNLKQTKNVTKSNLKNHSQKCCNVNCSFISISQSNQNRWHKSTLFILRIYENLVVCNRPTTHLWVSTNPGASPCHRPLFPPAQHIPALKEQTCGCSPWMTQNVINVGQDICSFISNFKSLSSLLLLRWSASPHSTSKTSCKQEEATTENSIWNT